MVEGIVVAAGPEAVPDPALPTVLFGDCDGIAQLVVVEDRAGRIWNVGWSIGGDPDEASALAVPIGERVRLRARDYGGIGAPDQAMSLTSEDGEVWFEVGDHTLPMLRGGAVHARPGALSCYARFQKMYGGRFFSGGAVLEVALGESGSFAEAEAVWPRGSGGVPAPTVPLAVKMLAATAREQQSPGEREYDFHYAVWRTSPGD